VHETLVFRLADRKWGLAARQVRQVLSPGPVTRLPGAVPPLCGLVAWRAQVLPLFDLARRAEHVQGAQNAGQAGDRSDPNQGVWLVVEVSGGPAVSAARAWLEWVVLWVDEVIGFASFEAEASGQERPGLSVLPFDLATVLDER